MKKVYACAFLLLFCKYQNVLSQNVGMGKTNPQEKLDVGGIAGQALVKNAAGTMVWGDLSLYKNTIDFPSGSSSITNTVYTWTVPPGVTKLLVEAWGGGGGAGYVATEWTA